MNLNEIMENKELKEDFDRRVELTFKRYKIFYIMELEEFYQECCIQAIKSLKIFDNEKSRLGTFVTMILQNCAKRLIRDAKGQAEGKNKFEFHRDMASLDAHYNGNSEDVFANCVPDKQDIEADFIANQTIIDILNSKIISNMQKDIIKLILQGKDQKQISLILNTSQPSISRQLKKAKEKICNNYMTVGI